MNLDERLWWVISFSLSLAFCTISVYTTWMKWIESPVTMSYSENEVLISEIPFPAVTICPATKTSKEKLDLVAIYTTLKRYPLINNLTELQ